MDKIYFYDLGIRSALVRNFHNLAECVDHGQLWENFIISERLKANSYQRKGANIYFWRVYTGAELDFIEEREGQLFGYEIKWQSKKASPPKSFLETYQEASSQIINRENFLNFLRPLIKSAH